MPIFIITAHIEFGKKLKLAPAQQAIRTSLIRMEVQAETQDEAQTKARQFIAGRTSVVVDTCEEKSSSAKAVQEAIFSQFLSAFGSSILGGKS